MSTGPEWCFLCLPDNCFSEYFLFRAIEGETVPAVAKQPAVVPPVEEEAKGAADEPSLFESSAKEALELTSDKPFSVAATFAWFKIGVVFAESKKFKLLELGVVLKFGKGGGVENKENCAWLKDGPNVQHKFYGKFQRNKINIYITV